MDFLVELVLGSDVKLEYGFEYGSLFVLLVLFK